MKFDKIRVLLDNATKSTFNPESNPNLNGKRIHQVNSYDAEDFTKDEQGNTILTTANAKKAFLKLVNSKNVAILDNLPFNELNRRINGGINHDLGGIVVNWDKSDLIISGGPGSTSTVAILGVWYED